MNKYISLFLVCMYVLVVILFLFYPDFVSLSVISRDDKRWRLTVLSLCYAMTHVKSVTNREKVNQGIHRL